MKKRFNILLVVLALTLALVACGGDKKEVSDQNDKKESEEILELTKINVGVSPTPHGVILKEIKDDLKEVGIDLEITEFTDYVIPNISLDAGDLDANYFQHVPYLEDFIAEEGVDLTAIADIHIEPMAIFSDKIKDLDELADGSEVAIPNDTVNGGRALLLLQAQGLIKLNEEAGIEATIQDVIENPKNLKFTELEAATISRVLVDVDIACINGNYALDAGLNPVKDSIAIEDADSPYTNVLVVRTENKDDEVFKKFVEVLHSDKLRDFINKEFDGAVIPVF